MPESDDNKEPTRPLDAASRSEHDGRKIGRYVVRRRIGAGGMGEVYEAWDPLLDRRVALKRITVESVPDADQRRLLLQEARAASALHHRSIVAIHDILELGADDYIVEEYAIGTRLRDRLDRPFKLESFFDFAEECVEALVAASEAGIIHCDLKPENILVTPEGLPRILDFGIARRVAPLASDATITGSPTIPLDEMRPRGTPAYLAPEVLTGDVIDARTDIFSLGIVFYEILTTRNPFLKDTTGATLTSVVTDTPAPPNTLNDQIPEELGQLVLRMMEKDRHLRPSGPAELLGDIRRLRAVTIGSHRRGSLLPRILVKWPALAAAILFLAVLLLFALRGFPPGTQDGTTVTPYLVVKPFENLTPDPSVGYFASGLLEAIETRLSNLKGVHVVGAGSEIGGTLSLEGSLQRAGDRLRISYRLVNREGLRLTGNLIEGDIDELFELQDRVTEEITTALDDRIGVDPQHEGGRSRPTSDVLAYELYLQARGYLRDYDDPANVEIAIDLLKKALDRDPDFALAYAGLADGYWKKWDETDDPEWTRLAEEASETALEKGPEYAEIYVTLGTIHRETGKLSQAVQEFERAIEIDKGDAAYLGLALTYEAMGNGKAAIETFQQAIDARPDYWANVSHLGAFYFQHGEFDKARACFERVVELTPENAKAYSNLGGICLALNDTDKAIEALEHSIAIKPNSAAYSNLAYSYRTEGRMVEAAATFEKALTLNPRDFRLWGNLASTYLHIPGKRDAVENASRRAIELAEPLLEINPQDAGLRVLLAQYYETIEEPHRARLLVERALELAPDQTNVLVHGASVLAALGDESRAIEVIRMALEAGLPLERLEQEPTLQSVRETPEFIKMVRELHRGAGAVSGTE